MAGPWDGFYKGAATLNDAFDTLATQRRQAELDARALQSHKDTLAQQARLEARQAAQDALNEPFFQARNKEAILKLATDERNAKRLAEYEAAYAAQEGLMGTQGVQTSSTRANPDYVPATSATPLSAIRERAVANQAGADPRFMQGPMNVDTSMLPTTETPAIGDPTITETGTRPMTEHEKDARRAELMTKMGQFDKLKELGIAVDVTHKLQTQEADALQEWATKVSAFKGDKKSYGRALA